MKIILISKKDIKNKYVKLVLNEYKKRLSAYVKIEYKVTVDTKNFILNKEDKIFVIEQNKNTLSSEDFSEKISNLEMSRNKNIYIFIDNYRNLEEMKIEKLSISNIKFSDEMLICILYEQIYRAYKIMRNETYHK